MTSPQARKLRIFNAVKRAARFPFANIGTLIKLGLVPALLALGVNYVAMRALWPQDAQFTSIEEMQRIVASLHLAMLPGSVAYGVVAAIFAVGIHRFIIRGEEPGWVLLRFGRYEIAYAAVAILLLLASMGAQFAVYFVGWATGVLPGDMPGFGAALMPWALEVAPPREFPTGLGTLFLVLILFGTWLYVRLLLTFPHAAVTGRIDLGVSWRAVKGNVWRIIAAFLLVSVLNVLIFLLVGFPLAMLQAWLLVPPMSQNPGALSFDALGISWFWMGAIMLPFYGLGVGMIIALMSYSYRDLVEEDASPQGGAALAAAA